ncbi:MAG: hypothetical protein GY756_27500 [bacterium]|nr:hypothetical protein [bacterium]
MAANKKLQLIFISIAILIPLFAYSNFNNNNILIGERTAAMGGTGVASANDISAAFYNPACLSVIKQDKIVFTASVASYDYHTRTDYHIGNEPFKLEKDDISIFPTSLEVSFRLSDRFILAISAFQIEYEKFDSATTTNGKYFNYVIENQEFLLGPSLTFKINENLAIGFSVFYHFGISRYSLTERQPTTTYQTENDLIFGGLVFVVGVNFNIASFKFGLAYTSETIRLHGVNDYSITITDTGFIDNGTAKSYRKLAHKLAFGIAYEKSGVFTIAVDIKYYFKLDYFSPHDIYQTEYYYVNHVESAHFDFSIGCELYITKSLAFRLGVFTNFSSATSLNATEKINMYGASTGLAIISDGLSSGIAVIGQYGKSNIQKSENGHRASWEKLSLQIVLGVNVAY